jgi:hypothetical protein
LHDPFSFVLFCNLSHFLNNDDIQEHNLNIWMGKIPICGYHLPVSIAYHSCKSGKLVVKNDLRTGWCCACFFFSTTSLEVWTSLSEMAIIATTPSAFASVDNNNAKQDNDGEDSQRKIHNILIETLIINKLKRHSKTDHDIHRKDR